MPSSSIRTIRPVMETILFLNPKKVLDLGFGFGKYGFLIREYLFKNDFFNSLLYLRGVEGYKNNINSLHNILYNDVVHSDFTQINNYIKDNDRFDLAIMVDTFEHIERETGIDFLKRLLDVSDYILISVPKFLSKQDGYDDDPNKFEMHRTNWRKKELCKLGQLYTIPNDANCKMFLLTTKKTDFHNKILLYRFKQLIKKLSPGILFDLKSYFTYLSNRRNYL
jgi:hypothetical protein